MHTGLRMAALSGEEKKELEQLVKLANKYMWQEGEPRAFLQKGGVHLVRGDFYAPVPTLDEIRNSWEKKTQAPYGDEGMYDERFLLEFLSSDLGQFSGEFRPPMEHSGEPSEFYWKNPMFSYSDAMAYYCFIRRFKPAKIVEIGSGYSTLVALAALERNGGGELVSVEPYPSDQLRSVQDRITLIERPVQESGVEEHIASLKANDILFIDSTHTVKPGGDCLYIYLKLLPKVPAGVVVHAHDIYLPFMFPEGNLLLQQYWIEQYLLWAYLLDNPRVKILYGFKYHHAFNRDALTEFMGGAYAPGGASFYFEFVK
jgi:hypothetical protein